VNWVDSELIEDELRGVAGIRGLENGGGVWKQRTLWIVKKNTLPIVNVEDDRLVEDVWRLKGPDRLDGMGRVETKKDATIAVFANNIMAGGRLINSSDHSEWVRKMVSWSNTKRAASEMEGVWKIDVDGSGGGSDECKNVMPPSETLPVIARTMWVGLLGPMKHWRYWRRTL
jgi:hypothetical protein